MDRTVPLAAARMLDFIRETEVGTDGPSGYNVIFGFNQDKLPKPVTQMTVDELIGAQASFTGRFGSSASGGYQFMRATLKDLKREIGLRGTQVMDADLQDRLGFHLMKRRGYEQFMAGTMSAEEFGKRLAMEWASFPVLESGKGAHRHVLRGQSYYSGDALNKSLVSPEEVEGVLADMRKLGDTMPAPVPVPTPRPEPNEEPAMPDVTDAKGGTPGSPVEKAIGAGKGSATGSIITGGVPAALIFILAGYDLIPPSLDNAAFGVAIGTLLTGFGSFVMAVVGAYRAPKNGV